MIDETWMPVKDYEDSYMVSSFGRIKSLRRCVRNTSVSFRTVPEKILKLTSLYDGYYGIALNRDSHPKYFKVHRLVAEAFIPNPDNLPVVNHKDGNKKNNHVDNLEWVTVEKNNEHARITGLTPPPSQKFSQSGRDHAIQSRRPVMLLETGQVFESRQAAADFLHVPILRVFDSLRYHKSIAGTTFVDVDD